jgi:2-C-methyl-D-erythritol 4-phosphate cytidylyltransferase
MGKKLELKELKIQSFVTTLEKNEKDKVNGGATFQQSVCYCQTDTCFTQCTVCITENWKTCPNSDTVCS